MPIYEFDCPACGEAYEELVAMATASSPPCPACGEHGAVRRLSAFQRVRVAAAAVPARPAAPRGGGCCGGACAH